MLATGILTYFISSLVYVLKTLVQKIGQAQKLHSKYVSVHMMVTYCQYPDHLNLALTWLLTTITLNSLDILVHVFVARILSKNNPS